MFMDAVMTIHGVSKLDWLNKDIVAIGANILPPAQIRDNSKTLK